jgi:predicted metal-dependent hydrolase
MSSENIPAVLSQRDPPTRECCGREPTAEMLHAFEQFNRGEYWEQHETLELVWRAETDASIRNFYKGILQIGVGFHHLRNGNYNGAIKVLGRGINYLKPYAPECYGVDVARLIREASPVWWKVKELGSDRIDEVKGMELPLVHLI